MMTMTSDTATESDFARHAERLQNGFAAMSPAPLRAFNGNLPQIDTPATATAEPLVESTAQRVLRAAGIAASVNLMGLGVANVESLTSGLLSKKETQRLRDLQAALDRLAEEINGTFTTPATIGKIALTFPAGDLPPADAVAALVAGDEGRIARRKLAKESARRFFEEQARPVILEVFAKIADHLAAKIDERHKAEQEAHDRLLEIYGDEEAQAYRPSPGLLRLCARRRQLLDEEIPIVSPPSIRTTLAGIIAF